MGNFAIMGKFLLISNSVISGNYHLAITLTEYGYSVIKEL